MALITLMHSGVPLAHREYWNRKSVESLFELYTSLITTPSKVLEMIHEPLLENCNEECVFGYLRQFVGNMTLELVHKFLRFVTGASVAVCPSILVEFNSLAGLARRPIAHTCAAVIELSVCYETYVEFAHECLQMVCS